MNIFTLTLNPAFDIHAHLPRFLSHRENLATITSRDAGGKGINISRALLAGGKKSLALLAIGRENGAEFGRALDADGLSYKTFTLDGRIRENITLHEDGAPETRISFAGFTADASLLAAVEEQLGDLIAPGDIVTLTGRLPGGVSVSEAKSFLSRIREKGVRLVIDSRSFSINDLVEMHPFLIKPNEEEAAMYLGKDIVSLQEAAEGAARLHLKGIEHVMISLGGKGAILADSQGACVATPPPVAPLSTIGAGDSSIAGFLSAVTDGCTSQEALRRAVAFGTAACLQEGTRPPRPQDVADILPQIAIRPI